MTEDLVKNTGVNVAEAFYQWKQKSEAEHPEMEVVGEAWDLLMMLLENYVLATAELRARGEKPCEGCPD